MAAETTTELFRQRARAEAARYGSDPWVFIRELLQNARDAGARRVEIEVSKHGDVDRLTVRDDGCGMSYNHARRYLFALYASSKEDSLEQAGKFGIGFWSVLRFEPSTITIRSRGSGDAWQVLLDGRLRDVEETAARLEGGTEIVLERPVREGQDLAADVMAATRRFGRFVTRRGDPDTPLPVTVDGRSANAELKLEAPSAEFHGKGFRGAVGLGEKPEVELFAQGLFVRSASSLQDLQAAGELVDEPAASTEGAMAELPSLAPRVLIDSDELDLLLARSDARYDKHLRRILRSAEKQLGRLITRQLQALRPQPFYRLWLGRLREWLEPHLGWHLATAGLVGLVLGLVALWWLPDDWMPSALESNGPRPPIVADRGPVPMAPDLDRIGPEDRDRRARARSQPSVTEASRQPAATSPPPNTGSAAGSTTPAPWQTVPGATPTIASGTRPEIHPYADLADRYRGPRPGGLAGDSSRLAMVYEPVDATPFFAALVVDELSGSRWAPSPATTGLERYAGVSCVTDCIEVRLLVAGGQTTARIPIPTGHRLDTDSVRFDGGSAEVFESLTGEALLELPSGAQGILEYRTGPATFGPSRSGPGEPDFDAPAELIEVAADLRERPVDERIQRALDYVVERVVYDRSPAAWGRYRLAQDGGPGFVEIALDAGTGDCDVQSGVLVTLLRLAGVEARLALGYVGLEGTVAQGLHAWVEVRGGDGVWSVADPSITAGDRSGAPLLPIDAAGLRVPSRAAGGWPFRGAPLLALALLAGGAGWLLHRRSVAGIRLLQWPAFGGDQVSADAQTAHLAALLGGALQHPDAFAGLPAMFHGRFVPLLGKGKTRYISLARARRMASRNHLFRSSSDSDLARRAVSRGVLVIDASTAEGRVLSLALGAIDLDHWSSLLERSSRSELSRRIDRKLERLGAAFRLREAAGLPEPWIEIALEDLKLGQRQILIDPSHQEAAPVRALVAEHPEAAAFTMLDLLLHRIELPESERSRILAAFAQPAVDEAAQVPS